MVEICVSGVLVACHANTSTDGSLLTYEADPYVDQSCIVHIRGRHTDEQYGQK